MTRTKRYNLLPCLAILPGVTLHIKVSLSTCSRFAQRNIKFGRPPHPLIPRRLWYDHPQGQRLLPPQLSCRRVPGVEGVAGYSHRQDLGCVLYQRGLRVLRRRHHNWWFRPRRILQCDLHHPHFPHHEGPPRHPALQGRLPCLGEHLNLLQRNYPNFFPGTSAIRSSLGSFFCRLALLLHSPLSSGWLLVEAVGLWLVDSVIVSVPFLFFPSFRALMSYCHCPACRRCLGHFPCAGRLAGIGCITLLIHAWLIQLCFYKLVAFVLWKFRT